MAEMGGEGRPAGKAKEGRVRGRALRDAGGTPIAGSQAKPRRDRAPPSIGGTAHYSETAARRLAAFPSAQVQAIAERIAPIQSAPWPDIAGCFCVLFTSRSGSTCLARELEQVFEIGQMREALNPPRLKGGAAAHIVQRRADSWFSFKAGGPGVIAAELTGLFDVYLNQTSFVLLVRRDIVAQAVSREKAVQTGQFHSNQAPKRDAVYDGAGIAKSVQLMAAGVEKLRLYLRGVDRPWRTLAYEDFADGDFTTALAAGDAAGLPRRPAASNFKAYPVARIGDATNAEWAARFRDEMDSPMRERIERHVAAI